MGRVSRADTPATATGWVLHEGIPCSDTLEAPVWEVYSAAAFTLRADQWELEPTPGDSSRIVGRPKVLHHFLTRFLAKEVRAKCEVRLVALDPEHTLITVQGGILTQGQTASGSMMRMARHVYSSEARSYIEEVKKQLATDRAGVGLTSR